MTLLDAAHAWRTAGCSVIPVRTDGSKQPAVKWKGHQSEPASEAVVTGWFTGDRHDGVGIVCGAVSGNLEMFEVEGRAVADILPAFRQAMSDNGYGELMHRLDRGFLEVSPSGGYHWLYRVDGEARGNLKLARRPATPEELALEPDDKIKVLLETRGEGGYVVVAPSGGRTHPTGKSWTALTGSPATIPTITIDERDALHNIAVIFDAMPASDPPPGPVTGAFSTEPATQQADGVRPGDDFNRRGSWDDILTPRGWTRGKSFGAGKHTAWTRPGKNVREGNSASTGLNDGDNLFVFSSSTEFDTEKPYSKFGAYALLYHNNDFRAAAKDLRGQGYGDQSTPRPRSEGPGGASTPDAPESPTGRPRLDVGNAAKMADWLQMEVGTGRLAGMFARGPDIVHTPREGEDGYVPLTEVGGDADGPAQVRVVRKSTLASRIQYTYDCYKMVKQDKEWVEIPAMFPVDAARVATDVPDELPNLRRLRGVVHSPVFRPDGTILSLPGYDTATNLLHLPEPGLIVPEVSEHPTAVDVKRAVALLDEMTAGFRFVTEHDRTNYYGLLLTPLLRTLAPPPYKLGAISSPQPGSGKTLLASIARIIHGGVFRSEMPEDDAELRKQITSMLTVTTGPVMHFDNVSGILRSSTLAGLLTSATWGDRPLGSTEWVGTPNDRLWMITGNNLSIGGDLVRRTLWVTIDPGVPNPELRTGFAIKELETWAHERRGELLHALLTIVRAWVVAGSKVNSERGSDGYSRWTETVSGALAAAGVPGTFGHSDSVQQQIGTDDSEWSEFLEIVHGVYGTDPWSVKDLLGKVDQSTRLTDWEWAADRPIPLSALPAELEEKASKSHIGVAAISKSLGMWLRNRDGRWAGLMTVRHAGERRGRERLWRVEIANGDSGDSGDSGNLTMNPEKSHFDENGPVGTSGAQSPESSESPNPPCASCSGPCSNVNSLLCDSCLSRARAEAS